MLALGTADDFLIADLGSRTGLPEEERLVVVQERPYWAFLTIA
jgi:hypothetical protein